MAGCQKLVVINPGNPTGSTLSQADMESIIKLCHANSILLLADEVYQSNIFNPSTKPFVSFKRVLRSLGAPYADEVELVSFHSISKGYSGECGRRGGWLEMVNIDDEVKAMMEKIASVGLCPSVQGQVGVDCLVRPPQKGSDSYDVWEKEMSTILGSLRDRSLFMAERFNALDGMECQEAEVIRIFRAS